MKPFINILLCLLALQLIAQEPVWIHLEDNYPFGGYGGYEVGVDNANNIFVIMDSGGGSAVSKISPDGNTEWIYNWQADSVFTEGRHINKNGFSYIVKSRWAYVVFSKILAVDNTGNLLFTDVYNDLRLFDIVGDSVGNAYATGWSYEPDHSGDLVLMKINPSGETEWKRYINNTIGYKIILDSDLNIYVVGKYDTYTSESLILLKFNSEGFYQNSTHFLIDVWMLKRIYQFAIDSDKNLYVTGRYEEDETWYREGFIYKFDSTLTELWHDTTSLFFNYFTDFKIDENKSIILSGYEEQDPYNNPHAIYAKYDENGNKLWHYTIDSVKSRFNSIAIHNNNYFPTGRIRNEQMGSYEYITIRLNSEGETTSTHILGSDSLTYSVGVDNVIDHNGNLICTGIYEDTADYCLTVKYDAITFEEEIISRKDENLQVYPNPAKSILNAEFNCNESIGFVILLYNIAGVKIKETAISNSLPGNNKVKIDLNGVPQGVYILTLKFPEKIISKKVIVKD